MTTTTLRNATLAEIADTLKGQADSRYDVVAHSSSLRFEDGNLYVRGTDAEITEDGVTPVEVCLQPTDIFDGGISDRLAIPRKYLRKMRDTTGASALLDANVNHWLANSDRQWFVRGFRGADGECGIARAFLSDRYNCYDNFDVLMAALAGIRDAGVDAKVVGCDLSERRMSIKVVAPEVQALAPVLLANYRSPFDDTNPERAAMARQHGWLAKDDSPVVFAGFVISNSETGGGAFTITPRIMVKVCRNGLVITKDALRKVHLGSQMDEGLIEWSAETNRKNVELVTSQATDAVSSFCNVEYVKAKIAEIEEASGTQVAQPTKVIEQVSKALAFTAEESEGILAHFISGGDTTAGGVMQAVTSFAQTVLDPDRAGELEEAGLPALTLAAAN
jgi:hypothetical protein